MPKVKSEARAKVQAQVAQLRAEGASWRDVAKATGRSVNFCRALAASETPPAAPEPDTKTDTEPTTKGATLIMPGTDPKTKKPKKQQEPPQEPPEDTGSDDGGSADEQEDESDGGVRILVF